MKLFKSFSTYAVSSLLVSGIPFFVLPILTYYLSPYDYGQLTLFSTYVTILIPLISLGATGLIGIEYFKKRDREFSRLFSSVARFIFFNFLFVLILTLLFKNKLEIYLGLSPKWVLILPFIVFLSIIVETCYSMIINQKKSFLYGSISVSRTIIEVSLTLLFIIGIGMRWEGRIFSWLATLFIMTFFSILYFKKEGWILKNSFDIKQVKKALIYGIPLVPHILGRFVINQSDAIFIAKMVSVEDVGIYRIGYQIGFIVSVLASVFLNIYSPFLYERLNEITEKKKIEIVRFSYVFLGLLGFLVLFLSLSSETIFSYLIDSRYAAGSQFVFWTSLSYFFWGGYLIFAAYIFYLKKTIILTYLAIINVILNLGLNYFLIINYGIIGAAYATTISFFVLFILITFISNKLYPMPWLYFLKK